MANVYLKDSTLTSIGSAIRDKTGESTLYLPSQMPDAIRSIKTETNEFNIYRMLSPQGTGDKNGDCWFDWKTYIPTVEDFKKIISCSFTLGGGYYDNNIATVTLTQDIMQVAPTEDNFKYTFKNVPTYINVYDSGTKTRGYQLSSVNVIFWKSDGVQITNASGIIGSDKSDVPITLVMKK